MRAKLEFNAGDWWLGAFAKRTKTTRTLLYGRSFTQYRRWQCDVWVCLLPCLPIHVTFNTGWVYECCGTTK